MISFQVDCFSCELRSAVEYLSEFFILVIVLIFRIYVLLKCCLFIETQNFFKEKRHWNLLNFCECRSCNCGTLVLLTVNVNRDRGPRFLSVLSLSPSYSNGTPELSDHHLWRWLQVQNLKPHSRSLNQKLHFNKIFR